MPRPRLIIEYAACPHCGYGAAAFWSDDVVDCAECGIYDLGDSEVVERRDAKRVGSAT